MIETVIDVFNAESTLCNASLYLFFFHFLLLLPLHVRGLHTNRVQSGREEKKCNKLWRKLWKDSAAIVWRLVSTAVNTGITVQGLVRKGASFYASGLKKL